MNRALRLLNTVLLVSIVLSVLNSAKQPVSGQDTPDRLQDLHGSQERRLWDYATKIKNASLALRVGNPEVATHILEQTDIRSRGWEYHFLRNQLDIAAAPDDSDENSQDPPAAIRTLSDVRSWRGTQLTTLVSDDRQVVVLPSQGLLKQIDLLTLEVATNFDRRAEQISYANSSVSGRFIATYDQQTAVKLWNTDTLEQRQVVYSGYYGSLRPNAIAPSPDGSVIAFAGDQRIDLYREGEEQPYKTLPAGVGARMPLVFSPDGSAVAACSGSEVKILDVESGAQTHAIVVSEKRVNDLDWTSDGKRLLAGTSDGRASLWDVQSGKRHLLLEGHTQPVTSVALNHDENRILTASNDGSLRVWDASSGTELLSIFDFKDPVQSVRFSRDGSSVVALTEQGVLSVLSAGQPVQEQLVKKIEIPRGRIISAAVSPDQRLIAGSEQYTEPNTETGGKHIRGAVHIWSDEGEHLLEITPRSPLNHLTFSRDSKRIIGCHYNVIEFWKLEDGSSIRAIPGFPSEIKSFDIRPDGRQIAVATAGRPRWNPETKNMEPFRPGKLSICTLNKGREIRSVDAHVSTVKRAIYASQGGTLVTLGDDEQVKIWNPESLELLHTLDYAAQSPSDIASRPGTAHEVAVAYEGFIDSIDVSTGKKVRSIPCDTDPQSEFVFSPDGQRVVTTSQRQTLVLRDFDTGTELGRLKATSSVINALQAAPHSESFEVVASNGLRSGGGEVVTWQNE